MCWDYGDGYQSNDVDTIRYISATPVSLPEEFHGQRSLGGYSPWGCKESDTTERLTLPLPLIYNGILLSHKKEHI